VEAGAGQGAGPLLLLLPVKRGVGRSFRCPFRARQFWKKNFYTFAFL